MITHIYDHFSTTLTGANASGGTLLLEIHSSEALGPSPEAFARAFTRVFARAFPSSFARDFPRGLAKAPPRRSFVGVLQGPWSSETPPDLSIEALKRSCGLH